MKKALNTQKMCFTLNDFTQQFMFTQLAAITSITLTDEASADNFKLDSLLRLDTDTDRLSG